MDTLTNLKVMLWTHEQMDLEKAFWNFMCSLKQKHQKQTFIS